MRGRGVVRRTAARIRGRLSGRTPILLYHRVADVPSDPFGLAVSPGHFAEQLEVLARHARPIPLRRLVSGTGGRIRADASSSRSTTGMRTTSSRRSPCSSATTPRRRCSSPATATTTTGSSGGTSWRASSCGPATSPPHSRSTTRGGPSGASWTGPRPTPKGTSIATAGGPSRTMTRRRPVTACSAASTASCRRCPPGPSAARSWDIRAGPAPPPSPAPSIAGCRPASSSGSRTGASSRWGPTPVTTRCCPSCRPPPSGTRSGSKGRLEAILGRRVEDFSHPYGGDAAGTVAAVRDAGFASACTTRSAPARRSEPPLQLPRLWAGDWDGETMARNLHAWFRE